MKLKPLLLIVLTLLITVVIAVLAVRNYFLPKISGQNVSPVNIIIPRRQVIGFLPYWLVNRTQSDYSHFITDLTYFSLTIDSDGTIEKYTRPGESEPGYLALTSGKMDSLFNNAKQKKISLSLAVFSNHDQKINDLLADPETSAANLVSEITPLIHNYGFTGINIDIEQVQDASPSARAKFIRFVKAVKTNLGPEIKNLSIDLSASAFIKDTNLADPVGLAPLVDQVIIMAYDYHYIGSYVSGPVAPLYGAGIVSEFDTQTAVIKALEIMPAGKIILGIPLYGYGWETIGQIPRSAVIPGSGFTISNSRAEDLLADCATCSAQFDEIDQENHVIYQDQATQTFYQLFYPDQQSVQSKINFARQKSLGGLALWALGYEGSSILKPLSVYHH